MRWNCRDPQSTVRIDKSPWQVVYVEGQVGKPGAVPLQPGMTALQAIAASGGLTDAAGASKWCSSDATHAATRTVSICSSTRC